MNFKNTFAPGECRCIKNFSAADFAKYPDTESFFVIHTHADSSIGSFTHENTFFIKPYKAFELPRCNIKAEIKSLKDNFEITLETDKPAFFVTLDAPGIDGLFNDNSFTLLPDRKKVVKFSSNKNISSDDLKKILTIEHLNN